MQTSESAAHAEVRDIELAENIDASQRVVYVDVAPGAAGVSRLLEELGALEGLSGMAAPGATRGDVSVTDALTIEGHPPVHLRRHVLAFFQGNRYLINQLVAHVIAQTPPDGDVFDLYAGVGLFAVAAGATRSGGVKAVERDRVAAADLAANSEASNAAVSVVHESVEAFLGDAVRDARRGGGPAALIVDPPRTGMSAEALDGVCRLQAARIVYVSCDVATLARDARRLVESGYALSRVDAFDMFPNTPHVETVVVFDKSQGSGRRSG
jgi:23S rRNA (uracil1939-C5)-methyltransferase